jgi:type II secretory pathway pseudopilin PulG
MWLSANKVSLRSCSGFTLLELVVASVITMILSGALVMLSSGAASAWRTGAGALSTDNRANAILSQIEQDIGGLILYSKMMGAVDAGARGSLRIQIRNSTMPASWTGPANADNMRPAGSSLELSDDRIANWRFGRYSTDFRLLTRAADGDSNPQLMGMADWAPPNLPTVVGYQVVRQADDGTSGFTGMPQVYYRLYRSVVRPAPVGSAITNPVFNGMNVFELANGTDVENTAYSNQPSPLDPFAPGTLEYPHRNMMLADGVVDFGIVLYGKDYDSSDPSESEIFPDGGGNLDTSTLASLDGNIAYILVYVRILTEQGATILSRKELDGQGGDWWNIVNTNSKVYTRLIPVPLEAKNAL